MTQAARRTGMGRAVLCVLLAGSVQMAWGQTGPVITVQPQPQIVQVGQTATFRVVATGEGTLSYRWRKAGVDLTNGGRISWPATGSSSTLTISNVTADDVGQFDVVVASSTSATATSWPARLALAGCVYGAGDMSEGQLGAGRLLEPGAVLIGDVVQVATGDFHGLAVKRDGTVWAWGWNRDGQLGNGTTIDQTSPVQVRGLTGVTAVAAGHSYSLAVKNDGTVWMWGSNCPTQVGAARQPGSLLP